MNYFPCVGIVETCHCKLFQWEVKMFSSGQVSEDHISVHNKCIIWIYSYKLIVGYRLDLIYWSRENLNSYIFLIYLHNILGVRNRAKEQSMTIVSDPFFSIRPGCGGIKIKDHGYLKSPCRFLFTFLLKDFQEEIWVLLSW